MSEQTPKTVQEERVPTIQTISVAALEKSIALATGEQENTNTAVTLLKEGNITAFIDTVDERREKEAREQLVDGFTSSDLLERLRAAEAIGRTVKAVTQSQIPFSEQKLQALVIEWQRREIERDEIQKNLDRIRQDYVAKAIIKESVLQDIEQAFQQRIGGHYPPFSREIQEVVNEPIEEATSPQPVTPEASQDEIHLPIPLSTLQALHIFATTAQFTNEGELAMSSENVLALVGKRADKNRQRVVGRLTEVLPKVKGGKGVTHPIHPSKHITQIILEGGLHTLQERVLSNESLFPEEQQLLLELAQFTNTSGKEEVVHVFAEAERRLGIIFDPALVEEGIAEKVPRAKTLPSTTDIRNVIRAYSQAHPDATPSEVKNTLQGYNLEGLPKYFIADALNRARRRIGQTKIDTQSTEEQAPSWETDVIRALATQKEDGTYPVVKFPITSPTEANAMRDALEAAAQTAGHKADIDIRQVGDEWFLLARVLINSPRE